MQQTYNKKDFQNNEPITQLSKKNGLWLKMALKICKNPEHAKDLVQDMYVRIATAKPKPNKLTDGYIFATLRNLLRDDVKKNTTFIRNNVKYKVFFIDLDDDQINYDISNDNKLIINSQSNER
jgi:DNA-directed RNA polymerase specialized sigma24 family protein